MAGFHPRLSYISVSPVVYNLEICLPARRNLEWRLCVQVPKSGLIIYTSQLCLLKKKCIFPPIWKLQMNCLDSFSSLKCSELTDLSRKERNNFLVGTQSQNWSYSLKDTTFKPLRVGQPAGASTCSADGVQGHSLPSLSGMGEGFPAS